MLGYFYHSETQILELVGSGRRDSATEIRLIMGNSAFWVGNRNRKGNKSTHVEIHFAKFTTVTIEIEQQLEKVWSKEMSVTARNENGLYFCGYYMTNNVFYYVVWLDRQEKCTSHRYLRGKYDWTKLPGLKCPMLGWSILDLKIKYWSKLGYFSTRNII